MEEEIFLAQTISSKGVDLLKGSHRVMHMGYLVKLSQKGEFLDALELRDVMC